MFSRDVDPPFSPETLRTPIYPALLAAVYATIGYLPAMAILAQVALASLTSPIAVYLARELPAGAGLAAGLAVALDPVSVLTANLLLTDTLFTTIMAAGVLAVARAIRVRSWTWLIAGAVLLAIAALTRQIGQFLPIALVIAGIVIVGRSPRRPYWRRVAGASLVLLMVIVLVVSA